MHRDLKLPIFAGHDAATVRDVKPTQVRVWFPERWMDLGWRSHADDAYHSLEQQQR
ncbi:MAG: hypothetical protein QXU75_08850 [Candidatus Methanomethylicaceae archaeon]